ncbi:MAG TPA: undecaprenyl-diphosphate phosphatase [Aliidongia sp.]|nr:undecaprenyl-diphosphate phosphatase [Aliidongia sp.]
MTLLQTLLLAIVQGITELFPISSVAHAVLTPWIFGWSLTPEFLKDHFLPFVVMLHLGTAVALLLFFWRDWLDFLLSLFDSRARDARRELVRVIIGTIPAALIGLVLERRLRELFPSVTSAGIFLVINGFILFLGERARGRGTRELKDIGWVDALLIGLAQSLALVPGFSRSGASIVAGFWAGLSHEASARFSMLLATPLIAGASLLEIPKLVHTEGGAATLGIGAVGGLVAGIVAFFSVWALMSWFRRHEFDAMRPFALYCWIVGGLVVLGSALGV